MTESPFNEDELAVQARVGVVGGTIGIRSFMPDQHRDFFAILRYIFVGTADSDGWPSPTLMTGDPGFVVTLSPTQLRITADLAADDPARANLIVGRNIALLGLDLSNRRRNRANGMIVDVAGSDLLIEVRESFGNCPQHIHKREIGAATGRDVARSLFAFTKLPEQIRDFIAEADTFFVATAARSGLGKGGLDVSHRGGPAGFVTISGNRLTIPDFRGNNYFNTLGNIVGEPRVGLLFVDFQTGDVLQLQGRAGVDWMGNEVASPPPQRFWHVDIDRGWLRKGAAGISWREL